MKNVRISDIHYSPSYGEIVVKIDVLLPTDGNEVAIEYRHETSLLGESLTYSWGKYDETNNARIKSKDFRFPIRDENNNTKSFQNLVDEISQVTRDLENTIQQIVIENQQYFALANKLCKRFKIAVD